MNHRIVTALLALAVMCGCQTTSDKSTSADLESARSLAEAPPGAPPGSCWAKNISPAIVETITEQVIVQPAEVAADGKVVRQAIYKTETRQAIIKERQETWFEKTCDEVLTPDFIATLQRALRARDLYRGPITGEMDSRTRAAIRKYQAPEGLDIGILSLAAARKLGIVALERDKSES